jgi:hypothetical protein
VNEPKFGGSCQCSCGGVKLKVKEPPTTRFFCHCKICQSVYGKRYADVTVLRASDVVIDTPDTLQFRRLRSPPNLNRGICDSCNMPAIGLMTIVPGLKIAFVPTHMFQNSIDAPEPSFHIFYHSRTADVDDAYPKHNGYWRSELAVMRIILPKLFTR